MCYADTLGLREVVSEIQALAFIHGDRYWKVSPLLLELAERGGSFRKFQAISAE